MNGDFNDFTNIGANSIGSLTQIIAFISLGDFLDNKAAIFQSMDMRIADNWLIV